jgi:putative membrane protein
MRYLKTFIICLAVALAIVFMVQNIEPLSHLLSIHLNLFFVQFQTTPYPTYMVILLAFFAGLLAASLLGVVERHRQRGRIKSLNKELKNLNDELSSLRNLPITSDPVAAASEETAPAETALETEKDL